MNNSDISACVYTCLIGGYEKLNEQAVARDSTIPFYCLTDDRSLTSETWQILQVDTLFPSDPVRSQRSLKITPPIGTVLPDVERSFYIDNSVILSRDPKMILDECLGEAEIAIPTHSYRDRVIDEFQEVSRLGVDDQGRIFEQLNHYALSNPEVLEEKPYWTAMLMRRHDSETVRRMMELWRAHALRYSRRDQLSVNMAASLTNAQPRRMEIDNWGSWFHAWPVTQERERHKGMRDPLRAVMPLALRVNKLERELQSAFERQPEGFTALRDQCEALEQQLLTVQTDRDKQQERTRELTIAKNKAKARANELNVLLHEKRLQLKNVQDSLTWKLMRPARSLRRRLAALVRPRTATAMPLPPQHNPKPAGGEPPALRAKVESEVKITPTAPADTQEAALGDSFKITTAHGGSIFALTQDRRAQELARADGILNPQTVRMWQKLADEAPWTHIFDIGANYGELLVHANLAKEAALIALEPNEKVAACLRRTCAELGRPVKILTDAVSDKVGTTKFFIDQTWSGMSALGSARNETHHTEEIEVRTTTLDALITQHTPGIGTRLLAKVDVEGHEVAVLRGGMVALHELAGYTLLIEVLHLDNTDLEWIISRFQIDLFEPESGSFVTFSGRDTTALRSQLGEDRYYAQDVVLRKRVR